MEGMRLVCRSIGVDKDADGRVPHLASVQDQIGTVIGNFGAGGDGVNFVGIRTLIPNNLNSVTDDQFGETVKRVKLTESGRPVEITPTVGGQNNR